MNEKILEEFDEKFEIPKSCPDFLKKHLSELLMDIKAFFSKKLDQARAEERERVGKIIEESHWECPEHGLPNYEKTDCVECNSALEINVVLNALLSSLANPKDKE